MPFGLDIAIDIDRTSKVPLREQVVSQLRAAIRGGILHAGYPMPASRNLAAEIGISRGTAVAAYLELEGEGWLEVVQGSGTFVADRQDPAPAPTATRVAVDDLSHPALDLRPGDLDPGMISPTQWRSTWRKVTPSSAPPPAAGLPELRSALAKYLRSARGLHCDPSEIFLCAGTAEALVIMGFAFEWHGKSIAVEDPGYPAVRATLTRVGARWVPVDASDPSRFAARLSELAEPVAAAYITPGHQYPLGHRLDATSRRELLSWSAETNSMIIEDDYDGEFRFGVPPLPSLAGIDPQANVVFLGTMSKVLDPGLRLTYLRVPAHLRERVAQARSDLGATVAAPVQQVVTDLVTAGHLSRHIARVRKIYADRRRVLLDGLRSVRAVREVRGIDAGLHVVAVLEPGRDAAAIRARARAHNILIADLDEYRAAPDPSTPSLVLGYGRVSPAEIRTAVRVLADLPEAR